MTLKEKVAKLAEVSGKIKKAFAEAGEDFDLMKAADLPGGTAKERVAALRAMKSEEDELGKQVDEEQELRRMKMDSEEAERKAIAAGRIPMPEKKGQERQEPKAEQKSVSQQLWGACKDGDILGSLQKGVDLSDVSVKTLMQTSAGFASQALRIGEVVPYADRPIAVVNVIPKGQTSQSSVVYMECTTSTNNAAGRAEGGLYGEAALAYTERTAECENISVWLPITDRQLEDVPMVQGEIDRILPFMLQQKLDYDIINGSGTTPVLEGALAKSGIQTQAKSGNVCDTFYKGMTKIRAVGFAEPSAHIIHPTDWEGVRLLKDNNGNYIWSHPSEAGPERMWGKLVVPTTAITVGTGLTGDFALWSTLYERFGIKLKMTDSHDTYFIYGKQAIRADIRMSMVWKRISAFCKLTGL